MDKIYKGSNAITSKGKLDTTLRNRDHDKDYEALARMKELERKFMQSGRMKKVKLPLGHALSSRPEELKEMIANDNILRY